VEEGKTNAEVAEGAEGAEVRDGICGRETRPLDYHFRTTLKHSQEAALPDPTPAAFISYSREDSEFALRLAQDLKAAGARIWLDQLELKPGLPWDNAIEDALLGAQQMLVILSPTSVKSENVRDEISYALRQGKVVIPVLYMECTIPLRLERKQHIDCRTDYAGGLAKLLDELRVDSPNRAVLDKAAEADAQREAAWRAREARNVANIKPNSDTDYIAMPRPAPNNVSLQEAPVVDPQKPPVRGIKGKICLAVALIFGVLWVVSVADQGLEELLTPVHVLFLLPTVILTIIGVRALRKPRQ
jgi:hypothetical protein